MKRTQSLDTFLRGAVSFYGTVRIKGTNIFETYFIKQFVKLGITVTQTELLSGANSQQQWLLVWIKFQRH